MSPSRACYIDPIPFLASFMISSLKKKQHRLRFQIVPLGEVFTGISSELEFYDFGCDPKSGYRKSPTFAAFVRFRLLGGQLSGK